MIFRLELIMDTYKNDTNLFVKRSEITDKAEKFLVI